MSYSFGAGRNILSRQAHCGACRHVWGQTHLHVAFWGWSPNGFGKAFVKRWMPLIIEFSKGFARIPFQSTFLRWTLFLMIW